MLAYEHSPVYDLTIYGAYAPYDGKQHRSKPMTNVINFPARLNTNCAPSRRPLPEPPGDFVTLLAQTLRVQFRIGPGRELALILGTGLEKNNFGALKTWIDKHLLPAAQTRA